MPTIPSNTISTVNVAPRKGAIFSPNIYSPGDAIAAAAGPLGTAAGLEGRKAQDKIGRGRDRIRAIQNMNDQFNLTARMYDQAADRRARDDANEFQAYLTNELNAECTGYRKNPDGSVSRTVGLFDQPYIRGQSDGTPESGPYTATAKYISEMHNGERFNGLSNRARRYVDQNWNSTVSPFLQKSLALQSRAVEQYHVNAAANLAMSQADAAMSYWRPEDTGTFTEMASRASIAAASKRFMQEYGSHAIVGGDMMAPEFRSDEEEEVWKRFQKEEMGKLQAKVLERDLAEYIVSDDDAEAEALLEHVDVLTQENEDGSPVVSCLTQDQLAGARKSMANAMDARKRRLDGIYNEKLRRVDDLAYLKAAGATTAEQESEFSNMLGSLKPADREQKLQFVKDKSVLMAVGNGKTDIETMIETVKPEELDSRVDLYIKSVTNAAARTELKQFYASRMAGLKVGPDKAQKGNYEFLKAQIDFGIVETGERSDGFINTREMTFREGFKMVESAKDAGKIDSKQYASLINNLRESNINGVIRPKFASGDPEFIRTASEKYAEITGVDLARLIKDGDVQYDERTGWMELGPDADDGAYIGPTHWYRRDPKISRESLVRFVKTCNMVATYVNISDNRKAYWEEVQKRYEKTPEYWHEHSALAADAFDAAYRMTYDLYSGRQWNTFRNRTAEEAEKAVKARSEGKKAQE